MVNGALYGVLLIGFLMFIGNQEKTRPQAIARNIAAFMICVSGGAILGGFFA